MEKSDKQITGCIFFQMLSKSTTFSHQIPPQSSRIPVRARILGLDFDALSEAEALSLIEQYVHARTTHQVCFNNSNTVWVGERDSAFRGIINDSDLNLPDGMSIIWAGKMLGVHFPGRIAELDFSLKLL